MPPNVTPNYGTFKDLVKAGIDEEIAFEIATSLDDSYFLQEAIMQLTGRQRRKAMDIVGLDDFYGINEHYFPTDYGE